MRPTTNQLLKETFKQQLFHFRFIRMRIVCSPKYRVILLDTYTQHHQEKQWLPV